VEDAREEVVNPSGTVRIAASPELGGLVVKRFLPALLDRYPDISIAMKLEYGFEDLQDPSIDLAFRISHVNDDRLVAKRLGAFQPILIASQKFADKQPLKETSDLETVNCLVFSGIATWTLQHRQNTERIEQVNVHGNIAVQGFTALLGAVESGVGVANMPSYILPHAPSSRAASCVAWKCGRRWRRRYFWHTVLVRRGLGVSGR